MNYWSPHLFRFCGAVPRTDIFCFHSVFTPLSQVENGAFQHLSHFGTDPVLVGAFLYCHIVQVGLTLMILLSSRLLYPTGWIIGMDCHLWPQVSGDNMSQTLL